MCHYVSLCFLDLGAQWLFQVKLRGNSHVPQAEVHGTSWNSMEHVSKAKMEATEFVRDCLKLCVPSCKSMSSSLCLVMKGLAEAPPAIAFLGCRLTSSRET